MSLMNLTRLQAAQAINQFTRCGEDFAQQWVVSSELPDSDLSWMVELLSALPLPRPASAAPKLVNAVCEFCGTNFEYELVTKHRHYCGRSCQGKAYRWRKAQAELKISRKKKSKSARKTNSNSSRVTNYTQIALPG